MKYVMLLRGVNVGGQRRVPMARLREVLSTKFSNVATYINSGNVIFASESVPESAAIAALLKDEFGFDVPFMLLPGPEIVAIAEAVPADWQNDYSDWKCDVVYLFDDVNSPDILARIGGNPAFEELRYVDHAVLSRIMRKNQPKSSILKCIGTELYRHMTVRNVTTARKLAEMVQ